MHVALRRILGFFSRRLFSRKDRRDYLAEINIHAFYSTYRHLWDALEGKVDALAALMAKRHINGVFTLKKISPFVWTLNIPHMTKSNQEMMAAVIQSDVLLALMQIMNAQHSAAKPAAPDGVSTPPQGTEGADISALYAKPSVDAHMTKKKYATERPPLVLDGDGKPVIPSALTLKLQPIFYQGLTGVVAFMLTPQLEYADGILQGYDVLPEDAPLTMIIELDILMMARARQELQVLEDRKIENRKILCPVHRITLFNENGCACFIEACNALPHSFRQNFGLDIHHMKGPWYAPALKPLLAPFKAMGFLLYVRAALGDVDAQALFESGIEGVSASFAGYEGGPVLQQRAKKLVKAANRMRLRALACDVDDAATLKIAQKAGFSRLVGEALQAGK